MRYLFALSLTAALLWSSSASALGEPSRVYKTVAITQVVDRGVGTLKTVKLLCPQGWLPTGYSLKPRRAGAVTEVGTTPIDRDGNRVDLSTSVLSFIDGYAIVVSNSNADDGEFFEFFITCVHGSEIFGGGTTWVRQTAMAPAGMVSSLVAFCPGGLTAIGAVNDAGQEGFLNIGYGMMWGTPSNPLFLGNQPDGPTSGATGWESTALNSTTTAKPFSQWVICGTLPSATTYIYSLSVDSARPIFAEWGAVPDNMYAISYGYDGFYYAANFSFYRYYADIWTADNVVAGQLEYHNPAETAYESSGRVLGFSGRIQPFAPKAVGVSAKATARVVFGITLIPATETVPAPIIASVVEFYNSTLDHYFMTAVPNEMSDLDSGVHPGWARTGQSFNVYATGSSGHTGRHPVCRAYGAPKAGLDSHFYSASMEECYSTLSGFNEAWLLEASEIFQMDLPDPVTGACPSGDVPVYRVWNKRTDSNHRYTTSIAIRDQMVAKGYVAEGYGPNNVTLCALP